MKTKQIFKDIYLVFLEEGYERWELDTIFHTQQEAEDYIKAHPFHILETTDHYHWEKWQSCNNEEYSLITDSYQTGFTKD